MQFIKTCFMAYKSQWDSDMAQWSIKYDLWQWG